MVTGDQDSLLEKGYNTGTVLARGEQTGVQIALCAERSAVRQGAEGRTRSQQPLFIWSGQGGRQAMG